MPDLTAQLRARITELEEELKQLRAELAPVDNTFARFLSKQQAALLMSIYKREFASYAYLDNITEENGKYNRYDGEMHQTLRTRVAVWKLQKKLKPYGITIVLQSGVGYYMDAQNKLKLQKLMEKDDDDKRANNGTKNRAP